MGKQRETIIPFSRKTVPLRDFIYLSIILTIVLITVMTLILSDSTRAGENLNFAATAVSIVLAILAIVITLTDSYGQKESIRKLEDITTTMDQSVENTQQLLKQTLENSKEQIKALFTLKDELKNHYEESIGQIKDNLYNALEGPNGSISKEAIDEIIEKSVNELTKNLNKEKSTNDLSLKDIATYIVDQYDNIYGSNFFNKDEMMGLIRLSYLELGYQDTPSLDLRVNKMFHYLISNKHFFYVDSGNGYSTLPF